MRVRFTLQEEAWWVQEEVGERKLVTSCDAEVVLMAMGIINCSID